MVSLASGIFVLGSAITASAPREKSERNLDFGAEVAALDSAAAVESESANMTAALIAEVDAMTLICADFRAVSKT